MKTRKLLSLALTVILCAGIFVPSVLANFNETGYPIVDEPITLELMARRSPIQPVWDEMGYFQEMEKLTNIKFKFRTAAGEDYTQAKQLALASMDLPDLFFGGELTPNDEADFGAQGILIPLEDLIEEHAPNFKKLLEENPEIRASITAPDGHIYALPGIDQNTTSKTPIMWLNGKWLEALGADKPETMDEFYELLKAFKEQNPGNIEEVIPLTAANAGELRLGLLANFGLVQQDGIYVDDNGKVQLAWNQPEFKEYLTFMNRLYSEQLLDNQMFSHTWEQFIAKGKQVGVLSTWPIVMVGFHDPSEAMNYPVLAPMTSKTNPNKLAVEMSEIRRGRAAITSKNPHPEATMRWIDHAYSEEGTILARLGIEGKTYSWNEEGQWILLADEGLSTTQTNAKHAPGVGTNVPMVLTSDFFAKEGGNPTILAIYEWISEELIPYAKLPFPLVYYTEDEIDVINQFKMDIDTYFQQMEAKFITGAESIEKGWDRYVKTLQSIGLDDYLEAYQSAYDRWAAAQ